jgi:hypothetical protein
MNIEGAGERERPAERVWEGLGYGFEYYWEGLIGLEICTMYCYTFWQSKAIFKKLKLVVTQVNC